MTVGDNIDIPIASRMFAITISTTMNGTNSKNPTSNASFNWLVTKAGISTWKSSLSGRFAAGIWGAAGTAGVGGAVGDGAAELGPGADPGAADTVAAGCA